MTIDLRSDTVTKPSDAMRRAMAEAEVGDDVFGDDPTVNQLQELVADTLGKEAALFVPSGTQSNLVAILAHCQRGDEYIVGDTAHTYRYEAGGAAVLGSVQPQPVAFSDDHTLSLDKIASVIKPNDPHFAQARLLCLENTVHGNAISLEYHRSAFDFTREHGLSLHLDGARLANAAVAQGVTMADLAATADTVSLCLSKGLGAPVGSVLSGPREVISEAHRWRKMVGGGMRQAGVLAAAGVLAIDNVDRTIQDHDNAATLAAGLAALNGFEVAPVQTNMVFVTVENPQALVKHFAAHGIVTLPGAPMRLVTHLDVDAEAIQRVIAAAQQFQ